MVAELRHDSTLDDESWPPSEVTEPTPRKCKRHVWAGRQEHTVGAPRVKVPVSCERCGVVRDPIRARRGKTARQRGNAYERSVAVRLGVSRVGQYGGKEDVAGDWIAVQCKNGGAYPERIDGWLRSIPERSDRLRAVVIGDAPGPGRQRRELIVLDFGDFVSWYGGKK